MYNHSTIATDSGWGKIVSVSKRRCFADDDAKFAEVKLGMSEEAIAREKSDREELAANEEALKGALSPHPIDSLLWQAATLKGRSLSRSSL